MTDDAPTSYGSLSPEAVFSLVGNEVRAEILRTLSDARDGTGSPPAIPFSELRERADVDVDSSQFNYHLQQLVGNLVERRPDADPQPAAGVGQGDAEGFVLRPEGTMLTRTIRATTVEGSPPAGPFEVGTDCYFCGTPLEGTYENALFRIQCSGCDYLYDYNLTPPGVLAGDPGETLSRVAEYNRGVRLSFARGSCPLCGSGVDGRFQAPGETGYPRPDRRSVLVNRSCDNCGNMDYLTVGELVLADPGLVAFAHDRCLDVTTTPIWDLEFAATDRKTTVLSTDPTKVAVTVTLEGDGVELVVDETLSVIERRRH